MSHLNNSNSATNGEKHYISSLPPGLTIFDIGSRNDSEFADYLGIVHYFEPMKEAINILKSKPTRNTASFYNVFGLSNKDETILYYPRYQSFINRTASCSIDDSRNAVSFNVRKAIDYITENNINHIDMIKIDTEGYELNVLRGFEDKLHIVDRIQFEYGGTYIDAGIKLIDVINYLKEYGFKEFSYIAPSGLIRMTDFTDHYQYSNIVCNK